MKSGWGKVVALILAAALLSAGIAGCGGDSSSADAKSQPNRSKEFRGPKKEPNKQATFGHESGAGELATVSALVEKSLKARAARDWAGQCATLSAKVKKEIQGFSTAKKKKGCGAKLGVSGHFAPDRVLEDNMAGPVAAFRVKRNKGYALYHGNDKKDWAMPMEKEKGKWWVGALLAEELKR